MKKGPNESTTSSLDELTHRMTTVNQSRAEAVTRTYPGVPGLDAPTIAAYLSRPIDGLPNGWEDLGILLEVRLLNDPLLQRIAAQAEALLYGDQGIELTELEMEEAMAVNTQMTTANLRVFSLLWKIVHPRHKNLLFERFRFHMVALMIENGMDVPEEVMQTLSERDQQRVVEEAFQEVQRGVLDEVSGESQRRLESILAEVHKIAASKEQQGDEPSTPSATQSPSAHTELSPTPTQTTYSVTEPEFFEAYFAQHSPEQGFQPLFDALFDWDKCPPFIADA